jgi:glycosyltransferase involved in cell wall biosynthesis
MNANLKVAIVHEWLSTYAGSERVVEQLLDIYPHADLFAVVDFVPENERFFLKGKKPKTTFIQRLPFAQKKFRAYLPLMPIAVEQHDLSAYDVIISSSHAVAKGVLTGPNQLHVSYVHSPIRYAWDLQHQYLTESKLTKGLKSIIARLSLHYMRLWDYRTAAGVDYFVANSAFIANRIRKVYGRAATVIYPPVDVEQFALATAKGEFYLSACRLAPYKRVPLVVDAFAKMPDKTLVLIGDGPDYQRIQESCPPNVKMLGFVDAKTLVDHMQRAKAMVFAAEEDFGIAPVEAQACGTPIIAFGRGGSLETVNGIGVDRTGVFFAEQSIESICAAVTEFEGLADSITPQACRSHAEKFSIDAFKRRIASFVDAKWTELRGTRDRVEVWE